MLMRLVQALRRSAARAAARGPGSPRAGSGAEPAVAGSRRQLVRAAGSEWRSSCGPGSRVASSLDGGLDRTAVLVWRDGVRAVQPMGR